MSSALSSSVDRSRAVTAFNQCNRSEDSLSVDELGAFLRGLGTRAWTKHEVQRVFDAVDKNGNGAIEMEEFIEWALSSSGHPKITVMNYSGRPTVTYHASLEAAASRARFNGTIRNGATVEVLSWADGEVNGMASIWARIKTPDGEEAYCNQINLSPHPVFVISRQEARAFVGKYFPTEVASQYVDFTKKKWMWHNSDTSRWVISLSKQGMENNVYDAIAVDEEDKPEDIKQWQIKVRAENRAVGVGAKFLTLDTDSMKVQWEQPKCACGALAVCDGLTHCFEHGRRPGPGFGSCEYYQMAKQFMELSGIADFIDHKWDRCYCPTCYNRDMPDLIEEGGSHYVVPRGWVGFGLTLSERVRRRGIWDWPVSFHGTQPHLVSGILLHGHVGIPGDALIDGTTLRGVNSAGRDDAYFYTSPTVNYAGLQLYATAHVFGEMAGQTVLQCRQNEDTLLRKQRETMGFKRMDAPDDHVCPHTPLYEKGIEVLSSEPLDCVPYRVCVRVFPQSRPPTVENNPPHETFRSPVDAKPGARRGELGMWL